MLYPQRSPLRLPGLTMRPQDIGAAGAISIGGHLGDVYADGVQPYDDGVELLGAVLRSSTDHMTPAAEEETIQDIVYECWESIEEETFTPSTRNLEALRQLGRR